MKMIDIFTKNEPIGDKPHRQIVQHLMLDIINCDLSFDIGYIHKSKDGLFLVFHNQEDCDYISIKRPEWFNVTENQTAI